MAKHSPHKQKQNWAKVKFQSIVLQVKNVEHIVQTLWQDNKNTWKNLAKATQLEIGIVLRLRKVQLDVTIHSNQNQIAHWTWP